MNSIILINNNHCLSIIHHNMFKCEQDRTQIGFLGSFALGPGTKPIFKGLLLVTS